MMRPTVAHGTPTRTHEGRSAYGSWVRRHPLATLTSAFLAVYLLIAALTALFGANAQEAWLLPFTGMVAGALGMSLARARRHRPARKT
ncbi:hypothetical protein ABT160_36930 [Streptomyces sp. NPDC001941]|uniref:hypothetical protein n=1 Tax=Streptomyces sp. NPDC001941 TaxID=3154659 RepID=UPI0033264B97